MRWNKPTKTKILVMTGLAILVLAGVLLAQGMFRGSRIRVGALCYHKFHTQQQLDEGLEYDRYSVSVDEFRGHLQFLQEQNIRVITAGELLDYIAGRIDLPEKCMLITVDDCSRSFYEYAYPILQEFNMPANAAIIGNRIEWAEESEQWRELYCTWEELQQMRSSGLVEYGAHTYQLHDKENGRTGTMMKDEEDAQAYRQVLVEDLTALDQLVEENLGSGMRFFVYPYYAVSRQSIPVLQEELGYELLFCGNTESASNYLGDEIHPENCNPFRKGTQPDSRLIKRYTPAPGEDFAALIETIFE